MLIQYTLLSDLTRQICQWRQERNNFIFALSRDNVEADSKSRYLQLETEFELNSYYFKDIWKRFGKPEIDFLPLEIIVNVKNLCRG